MVRPLREAGAAACGVGEEAIVSPSEIMRRPEDTTYGVPRFLSFIDLGYLLEAAKTADEHLAAKLPVGNTEDERHKIGNLNATRQSLLRAVFVSSYGIVEQNLDELVLMERAKIGAALAPTDLKDRGVNRSLTYATKVLGKSINTSATHWKDLLLVQELRNHLIHHGPDFADRRDHDDRLRRFSHSKYVTLRPMICFTIVQIEQLFDLYMTCIDDFSGE
ncbi:hypothetical protein NG831_17045 [Xanthomonas sacchari]|uniref:hypothetical protein n=1 Tax=Xanthomonas sacchari TaxID=56458 RepID=UPI002253B92D|nr:hypothetical protein [Xanthomonas sacchari]MCW0411910.1 hypothetical protein [Xanthomonas sacchari]UYK65849.1 hypothetical protein NG831_17045 [Xanthomonas sacchari]